VYQPLSLLVAWWRADVLLDPGSIVLASVNGVLAWGCLLASRRGAHRAAAAAYVAGSLLIIAAAYWRSGMTVHLSQQVAQLLPVLAAGLMLGRAALWATVGGMALAMLAGAWRDAAGMLFARAVMAAIAERAFHAVAGLVAVAAVLDAALAALRRSLRTARRRGDDLARARDRLQLEMLEKDRSRELLVHAQKLEAVGRLASGVAHDFGHLLSLVLGHARRGQRSRDPAEMLAALQGAESAARRASALTRQLLDFSRYDAARLEVFDAGRALAEMEPMLRQLFRPGVELALELAVPVPGCVRLDRAQLELIVLNLASNADQAMPGGGRFRLALRLEADGTPGGQVVVEAADTGCGMDPETLARCFEPFFTTRPAGQGTGLGLAVARSLVEAAGGHLEAESAPGRGSAFRLRLPRVAAAG